MAPKRSVAIVFHIRRAARTLHASSKKSSWLEKWKESRGAKSSKLMPRAMNSFEYAMADAIVNPSSWIALQPASRAW